MATIATDKDIQIVINECGRAGASLGFSPAGTLAEALNSATQRAIQRDHKTFAVDRAIARLFASAAVEMWHRALHSFVVSAGLTTTSPIWSAVAGYYASHYVVRGNAHLLGQYLLYRVKRVVMLSIDRGAYHCQVEKKGGGDREHKAYWKVVKDSLPFGHDPFFAVDADVIPKSDGAHRNKANYYDHVGGFGKFDALDLNEVVRRIEKISDIQINSVPIPDADSYPDLEAVQIVAYHRIVRFRKYLDSLLGEGNRFWNAHRAPSWCQSIIDFQLVEPRFNVDPAAA